MLAARLYKKQDIRIEEILKPTITAGEILLKVKAATVCGTDLRIFKNGLDTINEQNPRVLCHEFAGTIEEIGDGVTGYKLGQRVAVAPNIGCGTCDRCVSGNSHHCKDLTALGIHLDGGFAQYVKIPASAVRNGNVVEIPDGLSFAAAAANEAFSCVYSSFEKYGVHPGDSVVIIGAGAIGLMHAKLAKMAGATKIILNDLSSERLEQCRALEPSLVVSSKNLEDFVKKETDSQGANVVITACSVAAVQRTAFSLAALDGRVNFFGGLPKGKENVELDTNLIHYKQLSVTGTTRSSHFHYRKSLSLMKSMDADSLITHKFSLEKIKEAFENADKTIGLKQAIIFD